MDGRTLESDAVRRRLYTAGMRDGGKQVAQESLQKGFDDGFAEGAALGFRVGRLLSRAMVIFTTMDMRWLTKQREVISVCCRQYWRSTSKATSIRQLSKHR